MFLCLDFIAISQADIWQIDIGADSFFFLNSYSCWTFLGIFFKMA